MEILRRTAGLSPDAYRRDGRLEELGFGDWEGQTWKDLRRTERALYAERERDRWSFTPPGGESYATATVRVAAAIGELTRDAVVASHGGIARILMTLRGHAHPKDALAASIWQGRVLVFQGGRHRWV